MRKRAFGIGCYLMFIDVKDICGSPRLLLQQTGQFVSQCFDLFGGRINDSITDAILSYVARGDDYAGGRALADFNKLVEILRRGYVRKFEAFPTKHSERLVGKQCPLGLNALWGSSSLDAFNALWGTNALWGSSVTNQTQSLSVDVNGEN